MSDIDWTEDEAREAETGLETDRRCARVMGWTTDAGTPIRDGNDVAPSQQVSRTAEGAHRAREWLRNQSVEGHPIRLERAERTEVGERIFIERAIIDGKCGAIPVEFATAPTEHLSIARLVLVLAAEGVLDDVDVTGGHQ